MTNRRSTKRTSPAAPGVKILITTASIAATLGGWAVFASAPPPPVTEALTPITEAIDALPPTEAPDQAALPTIPALPTLVPQAAMPTQPAASAAAQAPDATATQT